MKYAVSEEGVEALRALAEAVIDARDDIVTHADILNTIGNTPNLGPHSQEISEAVDIIMHAVREATSPIEEISVTLTEVADAYEEVIDRKRFGSGHSIGFEPFHISREELDTYINGDPASGIDPLNAGQLKALKERIMTGDIVVDPDSGDSDPAPPQKKLVKKRR